jgi:hypothetical protein
MANEGDRKKSSRKKTSSKRITDAVEQAKQAAQPKPEAEEGKPAAERKISAAQPPEPEPIVEVRETTTTVAEEVETAHDDALPLLESEPAPIEAERMTEISDERRAGGSLSERASCLFGDVQRLAAQYIDASEEFARRILDIQSEATSWAEGTPLERVLKVQKSLGQRIVESSARAARALWRLDRIQPNEARG